MLMYGRNHIQYCKAIILWLQINKFLKETGMKHTKNTLWESESVSHSVVSDSLHPLDCSPLGSSVLGILQARILEWVAMPFSGIKPGSPALQADSWQTEPPGKQTPHENDQIWSICKDIKNGKWYTNIFE